MRPLWLGLGALVLAALCACSASPVGADHAGAVEGPAAPIADTAGGAPRGRELSDAARAKCLAEGGFVQRAGLLGYEGCYRRFKDAGKTCSDGAECQAGRCDYKGKISDAQSGLRGQCPRDSIPFGCRQSLTAGRVSESICVD